jgi:hypothetical protein
MISFRAQVKFFLDNAETVDQSLFMGVFQRWIQRKALDGLLIDVADYRHVFEGPGIILIGHESDYALENRDGRPGLIHTRKRGLEPDLQSQLRNSLRLALAACELLEADTTFNPPLKFRADEIEIRFADRLQLPNRNESFDLIQPDLAAVLSELYGANPVTFAPIDQDPRYLFTVGVKAENAVSIADLSRQLQPSAQT